MPKALAALALALAALLAGCASVRPINGEATPLGKGLEMRLPAAPGYPGHFIGHQTLVGTYAGRKGAFEAALDLSPEKAVVVITTVSGPRLLSVTWTSTGVSEDRSPIAPAEVKGLNILGDIFISLWPLEAVKRAMPPGVSVIDEAGARRVRTADRVVEEIVTIKTDDGGSKQMLRNLDLGYDLTILTDPS